MSADASGSNRSNNIQSHGTLEYTGDDQDVLLTAEDLKYLARECDKLEDAMDALAMKGNPNIKYTYHHHTGTETELGGCHTAGYHVHNNCPYIDYGRKTKCFCKKKNGECVLHRHEEACDGCKSTSCSGVHLQCGNAPINRWAIGCGWQEGEIEKAEIVFTPN